ncbi:hypothetical protein [Cryobacterium psychrophilum]|uniref:GerMN domain-containing protein n=1 Tax=Cryobacterium psychrophilum TaxID=41988 RepID=A0A4Y8KMQ3_9MICO|nr:hypothetical protein [Cryobacterium psychrophilum]TFD74644.1 hypothetical protein E3T53_16890 [Cryobacterium psychrophilum]
MKKLVPVVFAAALLLSACSGTAEPVDTSSGTTAPVATVVDRTADVSAALSPELAAFVTQAEEPETGRINVSTTIVDPRGSNGSADAVTALAICTAVSQLDGIENVSIYEADGTSLVLFGHPSVPAGKCGEV